MSRAPRARVLFAIGALLSACGGDPPPSNRLLLADLLQKTEVRGAGQTPSTDAATGALIQSPDTWIRWHLLLPENARLRGTLNVVTEGSPRPAKQEAAIYLTDEDDTWEAVFRAPLESGASVPIDLDLQAWGGRMVRVAAAFPGRGRSRSGSWRLSWQGLAIESPIPLREPVLEHTSVEAHPSNVLIVLFDTLRADRTQPFGSKVVKTPNLLDLAARGTVFTNTSSNASWTAPSIASLFTSTYPSVHGVAGGAGFDKLREVSKLPSSLPSLPVILHQSGYATAAVLNNPIISPALGFGSGFEEVHEYFRHRDEVLAESNTPSLQVERVWTEFVAPMLEHRGERPFFLFLHEIDPHNPYTAPAEWTRMYAGDRPLSGETFDGLEAHTRLRQNPKRFSPRLAREVQDLYNAEVSFMDAYLGALVARLEAEGLRDDTLVVFLSDHGESLMEHEHLGHGDTLYEEVLHVPLIFSLPGVVPEGRRVTARAELIDVVPTILDLVGIPVPEDAQGRSLRPLLSEGGTLPPRPSYAQSQLEGRWKLDSVRLRDWKLIRQTGQDQMVFELYDLAADPEEAKNLWSDESVVGQTLRQMLLGKMVEDGIRRAVAPEVVDLRDVDEATRERLRQLGYLE